MQLATIGSKYQVVIPKDVRKRNRNIRPGNQVAVDTDKNGIVTMKPIAKGWVEETSGMMTEAWKDIDPIAELERGRDEWEERLKKLGRSSK